MAQVEVTATNEATGAVEKVKSNESGYYIFPNLRSGSYKISGQVAGFETLERSGVLVEVERRVRMDLAMRVGEMKQVMEVSGTATTVDTMTSTIKDVVDLHRMNDLPLNGRNALSLQGILPGAIQMSQLLSHASSRTDRSGSQRKRTLAVLMYDRYRAGAVTVETAASVELFKPVMQAWFRVPCSQQWRRQRLGRGAGDPV